MTPTRFYLDDSLNHVIHFPTPISFQAGETLVVEYDKDLRPIVARKMPSGEEIPFTVDATILVREWGR
jgi:hypothetical protein